MIEWTTSDVLTAATAGAGAAGLGALLLRDWALSFLRAEFGPWLKTTADSRAWLIGAGASALIAFAMLIPAGLTLAALPPDPILRGAGLLALAAAAWLVSTLVFHGWRLPLAVFHAAAWLVGGVVLGLRAGLLGAG